MSTRATEKTVVFYVFISLVVLYALVEAAAISMAIFTHSKLSITISVIGVLGLPKLFSVFVDRIKSHDLETISTEDLKRLYSERFDSIPTQNLSAGEWQDEPVTNSLMRAILKFVADTITKLTSTSYIELSIFRGLDHPRIICYYNSEGLKNPRSELERRKNENYYRDKEYFAVDFMDKRPNYIEMIPDTSKRDTFSHITDKQREKLKSVVVYVFCLDTPCALVIASDKENTFTPNDANMKALINSMGMALHGDIHFMQYLSALRRDV